MSIFREQPMIKTPTEFIDVTKAPTTTTTTDTINDITTIVHPMDALEFAPSAAKRRVANIVTTNIGTEYIEQTDDNTFTKHAKRAYTVATDTFLSKCYTFTMVLSVLSGLAMTIYTLIFTSTLQEHGLNVEQMFVVCSIGVELAYAALLCVLRNQRPADIGCMILFYLNLGFVVGFLFCTHIKVVTKMVAHEHGQ